jgi:hypothetical protein
MRAEAFAAREGIRRETLFKDRLQRSRKHVVDDAVGKRRGRDLPRPGARGLQKSGSLQAGTCRRGVRGGVRRGWVRVSAEMLSRNPATSGLMRLPAAAACAAATTLG